eukprot:9502355-Ditylum_brightwellii.AAC.1
MAMQQMAMPLQGCLNKKHPKIWEKQRKGSINVYLQQLPQEINTQALTTAGSRSQSLTTYIQ